MPGDSDELIPPKASLQSWLSQLANPTVAVAFIGGAATIATAFVAGYTPNDKTLCRINTKQAETALNSVDVYVRNQEIYADGLALKFAGAVQSRYLKIIAEFSRIQKEKMDESFRDRKMPLAPLEKTFTSGEVIDLLRPLMNEFKPPKDENLGRYTTDATEIVRQMYNTCPR